jgi:hypothetical protein
MSALKPISLTLKRALGPAGFFFSSVASWGFRSAGWRLFADRQFGQLREFRLVGMAYPFLVGAVLAASVWIARTTMEESPDFERQQISGTVPARPLLHALANHRAGILRAFAISALGSITYYVGITYVPTFLISTGKLDEGDSLRLSSYDPVATSYLVALKE